LFSFLFQNKKYGTSDKMSPLAWEVWGSNPKLIKSPANYQRLATAATLMCGSWQKAVKMGMAHSWHPKEH